jgi:hypothetical protein
VRERYHFGNLVVDGRILLKLMLKKYVVRMETGFIWLRIGSNGGIL